MCVFLIYIEKGGKISVRNCQSLWKWGSRRMMETPQALNLCSLRGAALSIPACCLWSPCLWQYLTGWSPAPY